MFIFLPDSPVSAPGLSKRQRRIAVERLKENQTGIENKHLKPHQVLEAFLDYKLYMFFVLGIVCVSPPPVFHPVYDMSNDWNQAISLTAESRTLGRSLSRDSGSRLL